MLAVELLVGSMLGGAGWLVYRRRSVPSTARSHPAHVPREFKPRIAKVPSGGPGDLPRLAAANDLAAERLWKLGYAARAEGRSPQRMDALVRENVVAMLSLDVLSQKNFPRRPTLMSQLMQAVNDPGTASDKLSRMIAHDPVLTADVLRLANSSLYRISSEPIETIHRALVVCGVDALRAMLAVAMLGPVFRATSKNFPRLPRLLWERTARAARGAELYAQMSSPQDRFESQLVVLLNALGPLVVYGTTLDVYLRNPLFPPNSAVCVALTCDLAPQMAQRIAKDWEASPRLVAALEKAADEPLTSALLVGELLGTLSFLESQTVISSEERSALVDSAGLPAKIVTPIWETLTRSTDPSV